MVQEKEYPGKHKTVEIPFVWTGEIVEIKIKPSIVWTGEIVEIRISAKPSDVRTAEQIGEMSLRQV